MKRVLIVANLFHASPRVPGIATYLPEHGWTATIVTPPVGAGAKDRLGFPDKFFQRVGVVEANYRGDIFWFWRTVFKGLGFKASNSITEQIKERIGIVEKKSIVDYLLSCYQEIFAYPDTERTWKKPALKAASATLEKERFDAVLSSSPHPTSHFVAAELKKRFDLVWIADFRDPWTQNHIYSHSPIRKYFEEKSERKLLRTANALTAASPTYARKQEELHQRPAAVVTNGFDPDFPVVPVISLTKKFTVTYTGSIYTGRQDPERLLAALKSLILNGSVNLSDIEVRFYGPRLNWLEKQITQYSLSDVVRQLGVISRRESLQRQRESQVLLLLNWEDPNEKGVYPTKLFEYLSAQRPILATGGFRGDDVEEILAKTEAGVYAPTPALVESVLRAFYSEYEKTGTVTYHGNRAKLKNYSYEDKAACFARILDQTAEG